MSTVEVCLCFLILGGAFALVSLGVFLLKAAHALQDVSTLSEDLETTITKVNTTLDDVNYKMDKMNAPIDLMSGFFERKKSNPGILGMALGLGKSILSKKKS